MPTTADATSFAAFSSSSSALDRQLEVIPDALGILVKSGWYSIWIPTTESEVNRSPYAKMVGGDGERWMDINLLVSAHSTDAQDESYGFEAPEIVEQSGSEVTVVLPQRSAVWKSRALRLRCTPEVIELSVIVLGQGALDDVVLFGGSAVMRSGATGVYRSRIEFASVFAPVPTEPVAFVRPARSAAVLGVVGDADPGRLNAIFSPPPLALGFGRELPADATDLPGGDWLGLSVREAVDRLTFTTMRYEPLDGGFSVRLSYEGHTSVDGAWESPTLVLRPASSAVGVIEDHRQDLITHGLAPQSPRHPAAAWWDEPMFCGWGAQCARSMHQLRHAAHPSDPVEPEDADEESVVVLLAPQFAREGVYNQFLEHLQRNDIDPGTIVVDDRWQAEYGAATVDVEHWPDLKGWIADRHTEGRKVLLWWKAWDPEGLPADECVTDPFGSAVSVDPGNPAYLARLRSIVKGLLSPEGLDADGFKVDFTQRAPSGRGLRAATGSQGTWGVASLHRLLETLYSASKEAKADSLVITHAIHPSFGDVSDMVRLNDVLEKDVTGAYVPVADQLAVRHAIAVAALPEHRIDTDQWPMPNRGEWLSYTRAQHSLGVPALYYLESIDRSGEPIEAEHLAVVAETWREYRADLASRAESR
jgi:hypothetical protein